MHPRMTAAYLVARHETTIGEWIDFLRTLPPAERAMHTPRAEAATFAGALRLEELPGDTWEIHVLHRTESSVARLGQPLANASRQRRATQDWQRLPVSGVTSDDAEAYVAWLDRSGRVPGARLCTELEWERAARGADDREYPHGSQLASDDANFADTYGRDALTLGPDEVGAHPASRSPFGVDDLAGNVLEFTRSDGAEGEYVARGGSFAREASSCRSDDRDLPDPSTREMSVGLRVCASLAPRE
jgi:formylglycine-generating enzyme required for sulfatase activity